MATITEIIPDWFDKHMLEGDLFRYVIDRMGELETEIQTMVIITFWR